jgi:hypothetical protein
MRYIAASDTADEGGVPSQGARGFVNGVMGYGAPD